MTNEVEVSEANIGSALIMAEPTAPKDLGGPPADSQQDSVSETLTTRQPVECHPSATDSAASAAEDPLPQALAIIRRVVGNGGVGAKDNATLDALAVVKERDQTEFLRQLGALSSSAKISTLLLERMVSSRRSGFGVKPTHNGYAQAVLQELTLGGVAPKGWKGDLYVPGPTGMWHEMPKAEVIRLIVARHDGNTDCRRASDYRAIADLAVDLATDESFFDEAPVGLACGGNFYHSSGKTILAAKLRPEHRQRFGLPFEPREVPTPMFDAFLRDTFASEVAGESTSQVALLQEVTGSIVLGLLHKYQKAILFTDPNGRAGKGTMDRIIRAIVPEQLVAAVSPFGWDKPVTVGALAGARLNTVGELPSTGDIPAAEFKSVLGGDLMVGKKLYKDLFTFKCVAGHLFMSNSLIRTTDQSDAFFERWKVVEFPNSLLKSGKVADPELADRIIEAEAQGILAWALAGAERLLCNGRFSDSPVHDRLMDRWRRRANSLLEFIHEACELGPERSYQVNRAIFYEAYCSWCAGERHNPYKKATVKELLSNNAKLGIRHTSLDGYEIFRGVRLKKAPKSVGLPEF